MRPLSAVLVVLIAVAACAPPEQSPADTAVALVPMPPESAAATPSTATPLPAPVDSPVVRRTAPTATASPRRAATDTARSRPTPPKKAPGGFIMVPPRARDSLRMAPPAVVPPATSTRP